MLNLKKILIYTILIANQNTCTKDIDNQNKSLELIKQECTIKSDNIIYLALLANDPIALKACPLLTKLKISPYTRCLAQQVAKFDTTEELSIDEQIAAPYQNCQSLKP